MTNFWLVRLGKANAYAADAYGSNYVGVGWFPDIDLADMLTDDFRSFNDVMIPEYQKREPEKTKVAAGLACGNLWVVAKGMRRGDMVVMPLGNGEFAVGEVKGGYSYHLETSVPHRRPVQWQGTITKEAMSDGLRNSAGSIMTAFSLSKHSAELQSLISASSVASITVSEPTVEDPSVFALEKHLEDFLVANWNNTPLAKEYDIFSDEGAILGQQYLTDTGPIDILAVSKDKSTLLVVELKKGRASDSVVGQVQRYMGYVTDELAEHSQQVKGLIIALEDDLRVRRALSVANNIDFMTYSVSFALHPITGI